MNNVRFGRYIDKKSWLHNIDPRLKLVSNILLLIVIFLIKDIVELGALTILICGIFLSLGIKNTYLLQLLKIVLPVFALVFLFEAWMFPPGDKVFFAHKHFNIGDATLINPARISLRLYTMILLAFMLASTTRPLDITKAIEDLLTPLKWIKFPVHIVAMVIAIALQFTPNMVEHAQKVANAQAARGFDARNANWFRKIEAIKLIWIPLLAAAFNNALQLGYAMDARAYNPYSPKSRLHEFELNYKSIVLVLFAISILTLAILAKNTNNSWHPTWWI